MRFRIKVSLVVCFFAVSGLLVSCFTSAPPDQSKLSPTALPVALSAFYYDGKITVDFSRTMDRATVEKAFALYPGIYNVRANPATFTKLQLTSMCNGKWRVRNPNAAAISFTWDLYKTTVKGLGVVPGNSDVFFYTPTGAYTARVFVGQQQQQVKASNPTPCPTPSAIAAQNVTNAPFVFAWSNNDQTVIITPSQGFTSGTLYTTTLNVPFYVGSSSNEAPFQHSFDTTKEDFDRFIDPTIQGYERHAMRDLLATMPAGYRSNLIFIPNAAETLSNRNYLKDGAFTFPAIDRSGALQASVSASHYRTPQFYDRIALEPQEVINLNHYAQCTTVDSGPYWAAFLKPGRDGSRTDNSLQDVQGLTGEKLVNGQLEQVPTTLNGVKYLKARLRAPAINSGTVWVDEKQGCANNRTDDLSEVPNWYMGFFLQDGGNFGNYPFEGVLQYNCPPSGGTPNWGLAIHGVKDENGDPRTPREYPQGATLVDEDQDVEMEMFIEKGYVETPLLDENGNVVTRPIFTPDGFPAGSVEVTTYAKNPDGSYVRTTGPGKNRVVVALTGKFNFYPATPCANEFARGCEDLGNGKQRVLIAFDNLPGIDPSSGISAEHVAYAQLGIAQGDANNDPRYKDDSGAWFYGMSLLGLEVADCSDITECARVDWNPGNVGATNMNYKNFSTCQTPGVIPPNSSGIGAPFFIFLEPEDPCGTGDLLGPLGSTGGGGCLLAPDTARFEIKQ